MSNAEIDSLRAQLAASPRPTDMAGRRARLNALGSHYPVPSDVRVEPIRANGVSAEWTVTPAAELSRVVMFLHGGGYVAGSLDSHRHMVASWGARRWPAPWRSITGWRPNIRFRLRWRMPSRAIVSCSQGDRAAAHRAVR